MQTIARIAAAVAAALLWSPVSSAFAGDHPVRQKGNAFSLTELKVKVGDSVTFRNEDGHFHNIFSLSEAQSFDLGSFAPGQAKSVTIGKAGTIEIECAIHPGMKLRVEATR